MKDNEGLQPLIEAVAFALAAQRQLVAMGPHFIVVHRFHRPGTLCVQGELVGGISVHGDLEECRISLSSTALLILDFFCRHQRRYFSAQRAADVMNNDPFVIRHASNVRGYRNRVGTLTPASVRVYIQRIREQMAEAFQRVGLNIDPSRVLVSEAGESNVVEFALLASREFIHLDD
ncbi:MAG TPA: hypothetical protein VGG72_20870 [Bryobacteraceae bacterium]|jgi:hypothetical protein